MHRFWILATFVGVLVSTDATASLAQEAAPLDGRDGRDLALDQFQPEPVLKVESTAPASAKFWAVDVHVHPRIRLHHSLEQLDDFVHVMDQQHVAVCVSLDGGLGEAFAEHKKYLWTKYRDRFAIFANIDWQGVAKDDDWAAWNMHQPDFGRRMAEALADAKQQGASGLKIFKDFGLRYRNPDGSYVKIDDPRWDPIWQACGELGLPVIIHVADPEAFFQPIDQHNERWEELKRHPEWSFYGDDFPRRQDVIDAFLRVVERNPQTTFIGAHMTSSGHDLATLGKWLDKYPNLVTEIASRTNELGRQPYTARKFFIQYADRIMFGTDGPRTPDRIVLQWRCLETWDEYFPYAENSFPPQGFWRIYGLGLPDDVLRKVYYENAARVIPGVAERLAKLAVDQTSPEPTKSAD